MSTRDKIPNQSALGQRIIERWGDYTTEVTRHADRKRDSLVVLMSVMVFVLYVVVWWNIIILLPGLAQAVTTLIVVFGTLLNLLIARRRKLTRAHTLVSQLLLNKTLTLFDQPLTYTGFASRERRQIEYSQLHPSTHRDILIKKKISGLGSLAILDCRIIPSHVPTRGAQRRVDGVFAISELPRPVSGKTFISTEGDEDGFGHTTFWDQMTRSGDVQETIFEWNDFEERLYVATSDPVEARYILTPDFMANLHDWWLERKGNIRISFIGNQMSVLLPHMPLHVADTRVRFTTQDLQRYTLDIALPLWHILTLDEIVRERFRY